MKELIVKIKSGKNDGRTGMVISYCPSDRGYIVDIQPEYSQMSVAPILKASKKRRYSINRLQCDGATMIALLLMTPDSESRNRKIAQVVTERLVPQKTASQRTGRYSRGGANLQQIPYDIESNHEWGLE